MCQCHVVCHVTLCTSLYQLDKVQGGWGSGRVWELFVTADQGSLIGDQEEVAAALRVDNSTNHTKQAHDVLSPLNS